MLTRLKDALSLKRRSIEIAPVKPGTGWLSATLPAAFDPAKVDVSRVRQRAQQTSRLGEKPLWEGYRNVEDYPFSTSGNRTSDQVRTDEDMGALYAWLVSMRKPELIVEFGTAFGISGMFWLTGLNMAGRGRLMTYEPNAVWAEIADANLRAISDSFTLTAGIFEERAGETLDASSVDMAFIDAIHTSEFVYRQFDVLRPYLKPGALVIFDDIPFSEDMERCWLDLAKRPDVLASYQFGSRVGIIELAPGSD